MSLDESFDPELIEKLLPSKETTLQASVFVHSLAPVDCKQSHDTLADRLQSLVAAGEFADLDLLVWGDSICTGSPLTDIGNGERIVDAISEFYSLAAESQLSISPFFSITTVTSEFTEDSFRRIVPPCRCLALYDDEELVAVFPSIIDGVAYTPQEVLTYLEARQKPAQQPIMIDESA